MGDERGNPGRSRTVSAEPHRLIRSRQRREPSGTHCRTRLTGDDGPVTNGAWWRPCGQKPRPRVKFELDGLDTPPRPQVRPRSVAGRPVGGERDRNSAASSPGGQRPTPTRGNSRQDGSEGGFSKESRRDGLAALIGKAAEPPGLDTAAERGR